MDRAVWCVGTRPGTGMFHFGQHVASVLGATLYPQVMTGDVDLCYIVGLYDPDTYELTLSQTKRAKRRVFHWCGSDVQMLKDASVLPEGIHLCESENLRLELLKKGIVAEVVPLPTHIHPYVSPLPEHPTLAVYVGSDAKKYGADIAQAVVDALMPEFPDLKLIVYRTNQYTPEQMVELVSLSSVYLRLPAHDGSANSAREFMEAGRRAVCTADLPHASVVSLEDFGGIVAATRNALRATEPDEAAALHYRWHNSEKRYLAQLEEVLA